jgi:hypothetical protein
MRFQFRFVFWDVLIALMMEAARTSVTSVDNYFTRQYIPEDKSELHTRRRENLKSHVRFQVLTAASMKITALWYTAPCSLVEADQRREIALMILAHKYF